MHIYGIEIEPNSFNLIYQFTLFLLSIRTQGSTKIFKNVDNKSSVQSLNCILEENALVSKKSNNNSFFPNNIFYSKLAYIPDQISVYADSNFSQKQILTLKKSSNVVFVDWFSCGRGVVIYNLL